MQFTIRDICWLVLVVALPFGAYRWGVENTGNWIASEIRNNGYYDDRKWQAVIFPIRAASGKQTNRSIRFYMNPVEQDGRMVHTVEVHYADMNMTSPYFLEIPE